MPAMVCNCGLIKQSRVGQTRRDGVDYCNSCGLPLSPDVRGTNTVMPIAAERVTTLGTLPGHRTVEALGMVTELSATSGFTATAKGNSALVEERRDFRTAAARMGANAVLGLIATPFAAGGGSPAHSAVTPWACSCSAPLRSSSL